MSGEETEVMSNPGELERIMEAATDSMTDDMVSRLSATASDAMDLVDRLNRSGVADALPAIATMVNNGDLDRVAQLARLYVAAEDSVTDDMVSRLSDTVGGGLALLDQVNRSSIGSAIPKISQLVESGDLDRVLELVRLVAGAEDAMTDDMVSRLADTFGEGIAVLDSLNRSGVRHLINMMQALEETGGLQQLAVAVPKLVNQLQLVEDLVTCLDKATEEARESKPAKGGIGGLLSMMTNKGNQEFLRFIFAFGRRMRESCVSRRKDD